MPPSRRRASDSGQWTLPAQMRRIETLLKRVVPAFTIEDVHKLRVALRRCRSLALVMEEVDPHPAWPDLRRVSRPLFRALGSLRDLQVIDASTAALTTPDDGVRAAVTGVVEQRSVEALTRVRHSAKVFDRKAWRRLARTLEPRMRVVPPNGLAAQCLVLEKFEAVSRLHLSAVETQGPMEWHVLRVVLKQFRYAVESVLPARLSSWGQGLRHLQALLGEIHDLDVLDAFIAKEVDAVIIDGVPSLRDAIRVARRAHIERYCERMAGSSSLLQVWQDGLPQGARVRAAASARLHATLRAADPRADRTRRVTRLALRLFDVLVPPARAGRTQARCVLRAASQLHGIRIPPRRSSRKKAAGAGVRALPAPPGWTTADWELVSLVVRYHRGSEPSLKHHRFGRLPMVDQDLVRGLVGLLRIARELDRHGTATSAISAERSVSGVCLRVPAMGQTPGPSVRLALAVRLLSTYLGHPLSIPNA